MSSASRNVKMRLILFAVLTAIISAFFFFEPAMNIGVRPAVSMYQQIKSGMPVMPILTKWFIITISCFFGMIFLVGLGVDSENDKKKSKEEEKQKQKETKS